MARLSKLFSFTNWAATRPKDPLPGDQVDTEFAAVRKAVNDIDAELKDVRRSDGALNNGIVTEDTLAPGLLDKIKAPLDAAVASVAAAGTQGANQAIQEANRALKFAADAEAAAQRAQVSEQATLINAPGALQTITQAQAAATAAAKQAKDASSDISNNVNNAAGAAILSEMYAELSELWAEYMGEAGTPGDQEIPPNKLAIMGVTGQHWSSRWWATKAANAFGQLTSLYLGVHPDHNAATAASTRLPPAAGSIYYNSTQNKPFLWTGSGWQPFWSPQKAITTTLYYKATANQTAFDLNKSDLYANSFKMDAADPEPLSVHVNGVLLFPTPPAPTPPALPVKGDYTIDPTTSIITMSEPLPINSVVSIDVLTPRSKFAVGSVNFHALLDLNLDPITRAPGQLDGVKKQFLLTRVDGKASAVGGSEEVFVSVDGVIQQAGIDYNAAGARITFTEAPSRDSKVWALWMEPGGGAGGGKGVSPPPPPEDLHSNRYGWTPGTGGEWVDDRDIISVANAAARLALKDPEDLVSGTLVFERDKRDFWVYSPVAGSKDATLPGNWSLQIPGHPTDNILRSLNYDPSKLNSMAWEDNRDVMETVNAEADLYNPAVLPPSHLAVGKLVHVRSTGQLWECLVDGTTGTITDTIADWKPLGGAGVTFVGRIGNLPDPTVKTIPDGSLFMVNLDLNGKKYHRLYVFDATATNAAGVVGIYRPCAMRDFLKALRSDPDQGLDAEVGDFQVTLENGHKELKVSDPAGAWQTVYSEDLVKQWIAAGNLFQGTAEDKGHGTVGAIDLDRLPAQSALGITDAGHYYIYVGLAGKVIAPNDVGGGPSNIDGAKLNVGDWILVANTGTATVPVMKYTHVPGDLLAKSRGDSLYGLNPWAAGAYEQGSLVVYNGDIYKSSQAVLATDVAPGAAVVVPAVNPWAKIDVSGGVKTVAADTNLPATAANGTIYLVLSSARAGGKQALFSFDLAANRWQELGGGGTPLDLTGGKKIIDVGNPIGTVITFAGKTLPAGYLLCDGSTFDGTLYPELQKVLGGTALPDLRSQFIRGAANLAAVSFTKHAATTARPTVPFTGVTNSAGSHTHNVNIHTIRGTDAVSETWATSNAPARAPSPTTSNGAHTHQFEVTSGGDAETAPQHVLLCFLIKADDVGVKAI